MLSRYFALKWHRCLPERNQSDEILRAEHLVHDLADMVQILVGDLHKNATGGSEQLAADQQPVSQVGEVRVQAEFPRVAVPGPSPARASVLVVVVLHVPPHERLEVRAELHAVRGVHVDHLHLTAQLS